MKLEKKSWNLEGFGGGFMKLDKKISWNLEGFGGIHEAVAACRSALRADRPGPPPLHETTKTLQVSTYFFIEFHETTTKTLQVSTYFFTEYHETTNGIKFYDQKYPWYHQKNSKKIMKPGHKKKKMRGFYLKPFPQFFRKIRCIFHQKSEF